ncbi:MAG: hypothetical protein EPO26_10850 [Chloroflexota bacterium]|nr:MAG: hypothetical protein EPO26_10850 [Chloroflexota bacterium]
MPSAKIVTSWQDRNAAHIAIRVEADTTDSNGAPAAVEYIGTIALDQLIDPATGQPVAPTFAGAVAFSNLTMAQKKLALVAAARAIRDAGRAPTSAPVAITGTVTV